MRNADKPFTAADEPTYTITAGGAGLTYIAPLLAAYYGNGNGGTDRSASAADPVHTITTAPRHALVVPYLVPRYGERPGQEPRSRDIVEPTPTIVPTGNGGSLASVFLAQHNDNRIGIDPADPMATITTRGTQTHAVAAFVARAFGNSVGSSMDEPVGSVMPGGQGKTHVVGATVAEMYGRSDARSPDDPLSTVKGRTTHGVMSAFMAQHNTGMVGHSMEEPVSTMVAKGINQMPVMTYLSTFQNNTIQGDPADPVGTVLANGQHHAVVKMPFVQSYYSSGDSNTAAIDDPLRTATGKARFGLTNAIAHAPPFSEDMKDRARQVAEFLRSEGVWDGGEFVTVGPFVIVDIAMRMLTARELARAQGFPDYYDITAGGTLTDTAQRHKIGNSVCPNVAYALVQANMIDAKQLPDVKRKPKLKVITGPGLPKGGRVDTLFDKIAAGPER